GTDASGTLAPGRDDIAPRRTRRCRARRRTRLPAGRTLRPAEPGLRRRARAPRAPRPRRDARPHTGMEPARQPRRARAARRHQAELRELPEFPPSLLTGRVPLLLHAPVR